MSDGIEEFLRKDLPAEATPEVVQLRKLAIEALTRSHVSETVGTAKLRMVVQWCFASMFVLAGIGSIGMWIAGALGWLNLAEPYQTTVNFNSAGAVITGGVKLALDSLHKKR